MPTSTRRSHTGWFRNLLDTSDDVYFRYAFGPRGGFVYLSPSVQRLTGHAPEAFQADPTLCLTAIPRADRPTVRQMLRARRTLSTTLRIVQAGELRTVHVRTIPVVRSRRIVAVEGVARLVVDAAGSDVHGVTADPAGEELPTPQRLAALMYEVHALLHRVLPEHERSTRDRRSPVRIGAMEFDVERLTATEGGRPVPLTSRELMVLRYLLARPGRVVTREQLLTDVWGYRYTGDDRTVDVHISRIRRKLPSLASRLVAVKHVGYRLDREDGETVRSQAC